MFSPSQSHHYCGWLGRGKKKRSDLSQSLTDDIIEKKSLMGRIRESTAVEGAEEASSLITQ